MRALVAANLASRDEFVARLKNDGREAGLAWVNDDLDYESLWRIRKAIHDEKRIESVEELCRVAEVDEDEVFGESYSSERQSEFFIEAFVQTVIEATSEIP